MYMYEFKEINKIQMANKCTQTNREYFLSGKDSVAVRLLAKLKQTHSFCKQNSQKEKKN